MLLRVFNQARFSNNRHFHFPWIGEFSLDLVGNVLGQTICREVVDLLRLDKYPDFATGLDCVRLLHAVKGRSRALQLLHALDELFERLLTCTWSSPRDS